LKLCTIFDDQWVTSMSFSFKLLYSKDFTGWRPSSFLFFFLLWLIIRWSSILEVHSDELIVLEIIEVFYLVNFIETLKILRSSCHFLTFIEVNVSLNPFLIVVVKHFFVKSYPFVFVVFPVLNFLFVLSFLDLTCGALLIGLYLLRRLIYIRWMIKDWAYWIRLWVVIVVHIWVTLFLIFFWSSLSRIAK